MQQVIIISRHEMAFDDLWEQDNRRLKSLNGGAVLAVQSDLNKGALGVAAGAPINDGSVLLDHARCFQPFHPFVTRCGGKADGFC